MVCSIRPLIELLPHPLTTTKKCGGSLLGYLPLRGRSPIRGYREQSSHSLLFLPPKWRKCSCWSLNTLRYPLPWSLCNPSAHIETFSWRVHKQTHKILWYTMKKWPPTRTVSQFNNVDKLQHELKECPKADISEFTETIVPEQELTEKRTGVTHWPLHSSFTVRSKHRLTGTN